MLQFATHDDPQIRLSVFHLALAHLRITLVHAPISSISHGNERISPAVANAAERVARLGMQCLQDESAVCARAGIDAIRDAIGELAIFNLLQPLIRVAARLRTSPYWLLKVRISFTLQSPLLHAGVLGGVARGDPVEFVIPDGGGIA